MKKLLNYFVFATIIAFSSCCNNTDQSAQTAAATPEGAATNGAKVQIKGFNSKFLCSEGYHGDSIYAIRDEAKEWETFEMIKLDSTTIQLKNHLGKYISSNSETGGVLIAKSDKATDLETFILVKQSNGDYTIKTKAGMFLSADQNMGGLVIANRKDAGDWERFQIIFK